MQKFKKYLLLVAILGLSIVAFSVIAHEASAATYTWKGTSSADASINTNWNPSNVPTATDNVQFTSSYSNPCTFNLAQVSNFSVLSGYASTITQGSNNIVSSFYMLDGTFTPVITYTFTDSGNFFKSGGTVSVCVLNLVMSGTGSSFTANNNPQYMGYLTVSGSTTIRSNIWFGAGANPGRITVTGTMIINNGFRVTLGGNPTIPSVTNSGTINGAGTLAFICSQNIVWNEVLFGAGAINCPFEYYIDTGSSTSRTLTFSSSHIFGNTVTIYSQHASSTITIDMNGYNLKAGNMTIGTRGILLGETGTITIVYNWDSSAGTWTPATSSYISTGIGTTKIAAGQSFYNVDTTSTAVRTLSSNIWVTHHIGVNGTLFNSGYYKNVSSNIPCPLSIYDGAVFSSIYLNGTATDQTVFYQLNMPGYVFCRNTVHYNSRSTNITIYGVDSSYVGFMGQDMEYPTHYEFYIEYGVTSHIINVKITGLYPLGQYDIKFNTVHNQYVGGDYNGTVNFYLTGPWSISSGAEILLDQIVATNTTTISDVTFNLNPQMLLLAIAFTILGILTYASFKDKTFFVINGFAWIFVAAVLINPIQYTLSLIALFIGIAFALWGVYRFIK
jgi:hypothetical protein